MALVATVRAGFTKYRGQFGRRFLHLYRRVALIREHYSRMRSYQCIASRNLCLICRQPYAVWLRLRPASQKITNFERLTADDGLGEPLRARRRPRSWRALNCQAQTPRPQSRLKLYYSLFRINDRGTAYPLLMWQSPPPSFPSWVEAFPFASRLFLAFCD